MSRLSIERLRELLSYDPATGHLKWRIAPGKNTRLIGLIAGTPHAKGYVQISVDGYLYLAHVLAWAHHYGVWPDHQIDHRDLDKANNRISNLRPATNTLNSANVGAKGGVVGLKGVTLTRNRKRFVARIHSGQKNIHLGTFDGAQEAHDAYVAKAKELFGEFARAA